MERRPNRPPGFLQAASGANDIAHPPQPQALTNPVVTIKALTNKLARANFHILKERKPFEVMRCFA